MKRLIHKMPKWFWVCVAVLAFTVIGWKLAFPTNNFRYKVTVNVETPEGLKSGSAVREFTVKHNRLFGRPINFVRGEAVVVDLGHRGLIFALINPSEFLVFNTFPSEKGGLTRMGAWHYEHLEGKAVVDPLHYPLLIAFKNIEDPATVTLAYNPIRKDVRESTGIKYKVVSIEDHMSEIFGQGVKLKSIVIEMTKKPVTWNIEKILPWLPLQKEKGGTLSGQSFFENAPSVEKTITINNLIQDQQ